MKLKLNFLGIVFLFIGAGNIFGQSITGFSPSFGETNSSVRIDGSGFATLPVVTNVIFFNGKSVKVTPTADNQINVIVPFGATTGPIMVKKGGNTTTSVDSFTVIGKEPYVTSFSPINGSPGTTVTLNGAHFSGVTSVRFNGTNATFITPTTDSQIMITAPANVTTGPISLTRSNLPALTFTTSSNFFVTPTITSFSPANGRAGTNVVIIGKNFDGATFVKFNSVSIPFTVDSNTQITATPSAATTTGLINISTPGGQVFSASNFVVLPTILSFSPISGKPGTNVVIQGVNFQGTTSVTFNGLAASFSGVTSNQLTAVVPNFATSGPITVTTTNGSITSISNFFLPAVINTFAPLSGAPGTNVTLSGVNFTNATAVSFTGIPATFGVVNNTTITSTVPVGAVTGFISVTTPAGSTNSMSYFYLPPVITGFTPSSGLSSNTVTITGTSFLQASEVKFNGADAASFTVIDNTHITAVVPTNATTGPITVTAFGGTATSANDFIIDTLSLSIRLLTNNAVVIAWPQGATNFVLQANTNLSTTNWVAVTNPPVIVNGKNTVTNLTTNSAKFYRLAR